MYNAAPGSGNEGGLFHLYDHAFEGALGVGSAIALVAGIMGMVLLV
jgi:ABC-type sugar transport system permease subunit